MRTSPLCLVVAALALWGADPAPAQKRNVCPYCRNDPDLLRRLGLVSHGPFTFAQAPRAEEGKLLTTTDLQRAIPFEPFLFLETRHLRIASAMAPYSVTDKEKKKIQAELAELKEMGLKNIKVKTRRLDPWLRLHLYAVRAEKAYQAFLRMVRKTDMDFPADPKHAWKGAGEDRKYMGQGPYLGECEKFEILITRSMKAYRTFMERYLGRRTVQAQRWNFAVKKTLFVGLSEDMEGHRHDAKLHNALLFNLGINFLDGYRFYAYNLPVWLTEGVGHYFERRQDPRFNSFDANEGSRADARRTWRWGPRIRFMVAAGKVPPLAQLFRRRDYGQLRFDDHMLVWSLVEFLANRHGDRFAAFLDRMKGRMTASGPDSSNLLGVQRQAFKDLFGWSPINLEEAWKRHVLENYPSK
jgi:hypothetical protein